VNVMRCEFKPIIEVKTGERRVGGIVTAIRYSQSRKTIYMTMRNGRTGEEREWPGESAVIRTAVFTDEAEGMEQA
jgi:hypothetical protein